MTEPDTELVQFRGRFWTVADARFDESSTGVGSHWHLTLTGPLVVGWRCDRCGATAPEGEVRQHAEDCDPTYRKAVPGFVPAWPTDEPPVNTEFLHLELG